MAYATLAQLRAEINITATTDDTLLSDKLTRAQGIINAATGRVFEAATATRYYDAVANVDGLTLNLDDDLLSISTLTNGNASVIVAANYTLLPTNTSPKYAIRLRASKGIAWEYLTDPENAISVAGTWGFSATAPADIVQATIRTAAWLYKQRDSQVFDTISVPGTGEIIVPPGLPRDVQRICGAYRRWM